MRDLLHQSVQAWQGGRLIALRWRVWVITLVLVCVELSLMLLCKWHLSKNEEKKRKYLIVVLPM